MDLAVVTRKICYFLHYKAEYISQNLSFILFWLPPGPISKKNKINNLKASAFQQSNFPCYDLKQWFFWFGQRWGNQVSCFLTEGLEPRTEPEEEGLDTYHMSSLQIWTLSKCVKLAIMVNTVKKI